MTLAGHDVQWWECERDTALLVRAVAQVLGEHLTGDRIWNLLRLTWITSSGSEPAKDHWRRLKVPALASIFGLATGVQRDLAVTTAAMNLPPAVAQAAARQTGFVNFRNVWRNAAREWCRSHHRQLAGIVHDASILPGNDQARFDLAARIAKMPGLPPPSRPHPIVAPIVLLSPLVACLDPLHRFPVINGRAAVQRLLQKWHLAHRDVEDQVKGLVNLIGQFGITDAFMLDVLAADVANLAAIALPPRASGHAAEPPLPTFDEAERLSVPKIDSVCYRDRHDKMTNALKHLLPGLILTHGTSPDCKYDVTIKDYDGRGRDLLIEAKPDPDRASMRIAIGQLFDY